MWILLFIDWRVFKKISKLFAIKAINAIYSTDVPFSKTSFILLYRFVSLTVDSNVDVFGRNFKKYSRRFWYCSNTLTHIFLSVSHLVLECFCIKCEITLVNSCICVLSALLAAESWRKKFTCIIKESILKSNAFTPAQNALWTMCRGQSHGKNGCAQTF